MPKLPLKQNKIIAKPRYQISAPSSKRLLQTRITDSIEATDSVLESKEIETKFTDMRLQSHRKLTATPINRLMLNVADMKEVKFETKQELKSVFHLQPRVVLTHSRNKSKLPDETSLIPSHYTQDTIISAELFHRVRPKSSLTTSASTTLH